MPTIVFRTIFAFVRSVAVHSIKTFLVFRVIAECALLMIGGKDNTVLQITKTFNIFLEELDHQLGVSPTLHS
jgi:hypothetical protein